MNLIYKYKFTIVGVVVGALVGYLYYYFVGCTTGTCMITSIPFSSSLYGATMGGLMVNVLSDVYRDKISKQNEIH